MSKPVNSPASSQSSSTTEGVEAVRWTQRAVPELTCLRCGYHWIPRNLDQLPKQCPSCLTKLWNKLRTYQLQGKPAPTLKRQTRQQRKSEDNSNSGLKR